MTNPMPMPRWQQHQQRQRNQILCENQCRNASNGRYADGLAIRRACVNNACEMFLFVAPICVLAKCTPKYNTHTQWSVCFAICECRFFRKKVAHTVPMRYLAHSDRINAIHISRQPLTNQQKKLSSRTIMPSRRWTSQYEPMLMDFWATRRTHHHIAIEHAQHTETYRIAQFLWGPAYWRT